MSDDVTCLKLVEFLDEYLEGTLESSRRAVFNEHLAICPPCVAYMKTYAASVGLSRAALLSRDGLPEDVPPGLIEAILAARLKT